MTSKRAKLQEDTHFRVLRLLQENPEMSQRELAAAAEDKRRYAYILTPKGLAEKARITRRFLRRKMKEYEALKAEIEELQDEVRVKTNQNQQGSTK